MAQKDRKIQRKRGTRTCGHGSTQKHRGAGSRGGRGNAGSGGHKQKKRFQEGSVFGKIGFSSIDRRQNNIINVGTIASRIGEWEKQGKAKKSGKAFVLDLTEMGYDKVLGGGAIKVPITIKAGSFSKSAIEKIKKAGGSIMSEETEEASGKAAEIKEE